MELAPSWWNGKASMLQHFALDRRIALLVHLLLSLMSFGVALVTDPLDGAVLEKIQSEWLQHNPSLWNITDPCARLPHSGILRCDSDGHVRLLDLRGQGITGSLLPEIGYMTSLEILYLSQNNITGSIPLSYRQLVKLQQLELSQTQISGHIPEWLGALPRLECLAISDSKGAGKLTGYIPQELGSLDTLSRLYLSGNNLIGEIPPSLGTLPSLSHIDLSSNQLWGSIPVTFQDSQLLEWNFSTNYLRGLVPENLRARTEPQFFLKSLEHNCYNIVDLTTTPEASSLAAQRSRFDCASFYNRSMSSPLPPPMTAVSSQEFIRARALAESPRTSNGIPEDVAMTPTAQEDVPPPSAGANAPAPSPSPSQATAPHQSGGADKSGKEKKSSGSSPIPVFAGGGAALVLVLVLVVVAVIFLRRRCRKSTKDSESPPAVVQPTRNKGSDKDLKKHIPTAHALEAQFISLEGLPNAPILFSFEEIRKATENFAAERKLGDNGLGSMYRGVLPSDGREVAIKVLPDSAQQVSHEFLTQVSITCQLRHPHLVRLRGWCAGKAKPPILVYKYYHGGSLDKRLFSKEGAPIMPWNERFRVLKGVALALNYMHEERKEPTVHRDVKCSNVMLDIDGNGYLGNYGLAAMDQDLPAAGRHAKTYAHMPPESYTVVSIEPTKPTVKWDTFSFGVLCLEIASGQRAYDRERATEEDGNEKFLWWHALKKFKAGKLRSLADPNLEGTEHVEDEVFRVLSVGICCVTRRPEFRPPMSQVLQMLEAPADAPVPAPPAEAEDSALTPIFSKQRRPVGRNIERGRMSPKRPSVGPMLSTIKESHM